jgi:hypothetical protein
VVAGSARERVVVGARLSVQPARLPHAKAAAANPAAASRRDAIELKVAARNGSGPENQAELLRDQDELRDGLNGAVSFISLLPILPVETAPRKP